MCKIALCFTVREDRESLTNLALLMYGSEKDGLGVVQFGKHSPKILKSVNPTVAEGFFGTLRSTGGALIHARKATCAVTEDNTHPIVDLKSGWGVVHNGVVKYTPTELKLSTCDSEKLLLSFLKYKVHSSLKNMQKVIQEVEGWYSVIWFREDTILILRDLDTPLYRCTSMLGSTFFITDYTDLIKAGIRLTSCNLIPPYTLIPLKVHYTGFIEQDHLSFNGRFKSPKKVSSVLRYSWGS